VARVYLAKDAAWSSHREGVLVLARDAAIPSTHMLLLQLVRQRRAALPPCVRRYGTG
jgi:hypothetical protein